MTVRVERLADCHQCAGFDCGEPALNDFLQRQASQLNRKGYVKTYVALAEDGATVAGFVTVSAGQVQARQFPTNLKSPRYPGAVLRVRHLAVATGQQGCGIGQQLMAFALQLAFACSQQVGLYGVIVDAKHDKARLFYETLGFTSTLDDPLCLYLPMTCICAKPP